LHACQRRPNLSSSDARFSIIMIPRTWVLVGVALACGGATGFLVSQHLPVTKTAPANTATNTLSVPKRLPPTPLASEVPTDGLNTADLESRLRALLSCPGRKKYQRVNELARSIPLADTTNALGLAEKILPRQDFWTFRYTLLEKWAESDPQAVLAFGQSLKNRSECQTA